MMRRGWVAWAIGMSLVASGCGRGGGEDGVDRAVGLVNGDFESGTAEPWVLHPNADPAAYRLAVGSAYAHHGRHGARLEQVAAAPWGALLQHVAPEDLYGERLALTAWMRAGEVDGSVSLVARMPRASEPFELHELKLGPDQLGEHWRHWQLEFVVPEDASDIEIAVVLSGAGRVDIDDLQLAHAGPDASR